MSARQLMKEKRAAPTVAEFSARIDRRVLRRNQHEAEFIFAGERRGDFDVVSDWVAVTGKVRAERIDNFGDDVEVGGNRRGR